MPLETVRERILAFFPPERRDHAAVREVADRLDDLVASGTLAERADAFVRLTRWVRRGDLEGGEAAPPSSELPGDRAHLDLLLHLLDGLPELRDHVAGSLRALLAECDGTGLFAEAGIPSNRSFLAELGDRIMERLLPAPRDDRDLAKLVRRLLPGRREVALFGRLPAETFERLARLLFPPEHPEA